VKLKDKIIMEMNRKIKIEETVHVVSWKNNMNIDENIDICKEDNIKTMIKERK
jgi:hypothetical protein